MVVHLGVFLLALGLIVGLAAVLAILGGIQSLKAHMRHHGAIPVFWRWVSGSHHHAREPYAQMSPDYSRKWFERQGLSPHWAKPWYKRRLPARLRRIIYRLAIPFAVPWWLFAWFANDAGVWFLTAVVTSFLVIETVRHEELTLKRRRHYRDWVKPLGESLRAEIPEPMPDKVSNWVFVSDDRKFCFVDFPRHFSATDIKRDRIIKIVKDTLGMDDSASVTWKLLSRFSRLFVHDRPPAPSHVTLNGNGKDVPGIAGEIEKARARETDYLRTIVLGRGRGGDPIWVSLATDSPNIGLSIPPGGGKSQAARLIAAQVLHRGGVVLILDVKRLSHQWAKGLPNVRYCKTVEEIHAALLWLHKEIDRRTDIADVHSDLEGEVLVNVGPRVLVIAEEVNETMARLRRHWAETRNPRKDPAKSPAVSYFEEALYMGRQVRINVLAAAQMMTAQSVGSGAARECMGVRILGRFSRNNWRMLCPEFEMPERSMHPGRVQVVTHEVRECQIAFLSAADARTYASNGDVTPFPRDEFIDGTPEIEGEPVEGVIVQPDEVPETVVSHPQDRPVIGAPAWEVTLNGLGSGSYEPDTITLREAVGRYPGVTINALSMARRNDPKFPKDVGRSGRSLTYYTHELDAWHHARKGDKAGMIETDQAV